ncbi:MAG: molybdenum cofactor guanylyltransferase [Chloroflexi bacterium]|nr:molybdenum cofactor guanylyltransferase [Chloroflexota bacterium]
MNLDTPPRVSGVILAGGKSRRMGRDKAFIKFDGKPIIARVIERIQPLCSELIIVANDRDAYASFDAQIISDVYPGKGSLGGLYTGLHAARTDYVLAVACDMPFLNRDLLRFMISLAADFDVTIPRARDLSRNLAQNRRGDGAPGFKRALLAKEINLHPTHAIYSKNCLAPIHAKLMADELRLIGFHDGLRVRVVELDEIDRFDPKRLSFFNANTPDDLAIADSFHGK